MGMALKIRTILLERHMSIKELSEKLGYHGANLYNKLNRDNFSERELRDIADALNCDFDGIFTYRDTGKRCDTIDRRTCSGFGERKRRCTPAAEIQETDTCMYGTGSIA